MSDADNFKACARAYDNMNADDDAAERPQKEDPFPPKWVVCRGCGVHVRRVNRGNLCEQCDEELA